MPGRLPGPQFFLDSPCPSAVALEIRPTHKTSQPNAREIGFMERKTLCAAGPWVPVADSRVVARLVVRRWIRVPAFGVTFDGGAVVFHLALELVARRDGH